MIKLSRSYSESIINPEISLKKSDKDSDFFSRPSYSRDSKLLQTVGFREDKGISIEEIRFHERKVKKEEVSLNDNTFFKQSVIEEINRSFTKKVVKIDNLLEPFLSL